MNYLRVILLLLGYASLSLAPAAGCFAARKTQLATGRPADAVEVFRCDFDEAWDVNYDAWPDRWTRDEGAGYPHYVSMEIVESPETESGRQLRILLDGAQAHIASPPVRVLPKFSYFLDLKVKVSQAPESRVWIRLDYLNPAGEVRQTIRSADLPSTGEWTTVELDAGRPQHTDIDRAVLHVETLRGPKGDLQGEVAIADIWMGRKPSLEVTANNPFHVYTDPRDVVVTCSLSGISERNPEIRFQLLDATSSELVRSNETLDGEAIPEEKLSRDKLIREESRRASDIVDGIGNHATGYEGSQEWRPEIEKYGGYGFYQVRVKMLSGDTGEEIDTKSITLAVIPPPVAKVRGEFGWSLPQADEPLDFESLENFLPLVGVNWVKLPIWFSPENPHRGEAIIQFAERLSANDIETVGVIQHPESLTPSEEAASTRLSSTAYDVANVFGGDPSRWMPLYDHIMSRLSLRIRWWQLGADGDTSFVGYPDLVRQIREIRQNLYRFGQDVGLGIGWRWDTPLLSKAISWEFQQLASQPPLDAGQLDAQLASAGPHAGQRWVLVNIASGETAAKDSAPLSHAVRKQRHIARVRAFIEQIVIAKKHGADGIFLPDPFSGWHGVMTEEGKPGELLLPWRTAATLLGGATYMGQLQLPSGSENWLFRRADGQVVMVAWSDQATAGPVTETLYLGEKVQAIDVWGKPMPNKKVGDQDVIEVGRMPSFVLGLNESVARWRMAVRFENESVPSVFGQQHPNALQMTNTFPQGVGIKTSLLVPDRLRTDLNGRPLPNTAWQISAPGDAFSSAAGEAIRLPLEIELNDAAIGEQPIRIDFEIDADRVEESYRFSVWRSLHVGRGDIEIHIETKLDDNNRLIVEQELRNHSGAPMSFKCFLQAESRRRKRAQVFELGPEPDRKRYVYSDGQDLIDTELTLRAIEINGPRVLINRVLVTP